MSVKALVPARLNLVASLPHKGTAMRGLETTGRRP